MHIKTVYIGVDPGKKGFITLNKEGEYIFYSMPYCKVLSDTVRKKGKPTTKSIFHIEGLRDIYHEICKETKGYIVKVGIEEVGGRGGWSASSNFEFGYTAGVQRMLFTLLGAEILMIRPKKWQEYMRKDYGDIEKTGDNDSKEKRDPKEIAKIIVEKEFPSIDFRKTQRSRIADDNKIDSFLICNYLMRINS